MTRDQRLIGLFAVLASLTAAFVVIGIRDGAPPPVPVVSRDVSAGADGVLTVQFMGDTMVGGALQPLVDQRGYDWPFENLRARTLAEDFVVAAPAAPITERVQPADPAAQLYNMRPPAAAALGRAGVDALAMSSEHVFDTGPEGLADTMAHAEAAGLATFGAGPDLARAEQPLMLRTEFGTIGVVSMGDSSGDRARDFIPGGLVLGPNTIVRQRDLARAAGADWVVAVVHWGTSGAVRPQQRVWAEAFASAGYDLVVGTGPHTTQPIELIGSMPVIYSLGNFVYGTKGRFARLGDRGFGLTVGLELSRQQPPRVTVRCLVADNLRTGFQPTYCDGPQSTGFLPQLGPAVRVEGDRAVLVCDCPARREVRDSG